MINKAILEAVGAEYASNDMLPKGRMKIVPETPLVEFFRETIPGDLDTKPANDIETAKKAITRANGEERLTAIKTYAKEMGQVVGLEAKRAFHQILPCVGWAYREHNKLLQENIVLHKMDYSSNFTIQEFERPSILDFDILESFIEASKDDNIEKAALKKPSDILNILEGKDLFNDILYTKVAYIDEAIERVVHTFSRVNSDALDAPSNEEEGIVERKLVKEILAKVHARPSLEDQSFGSGSCYLSSVLSLLFYRGLKDVELADESMRNDFINQAYIGTRYWGSVIHKLDNEFKRNVKKGSIFVAGQENLSPTNIKSLIIDNDSKVKVLVYGPTLTALQELNGWDIFDSVKGAAVGGFLSEEVDIKFILENKQMLSNKYSDFKMELNNQRAVIGKTIVLNVVCKVAQGVRDVLDQSGAETKHLETLKSRDLENYINQALNENTNIKVLYNTIISKIYDKDTMSYQLLSPVINSLTFKEDGTPNWDAQEATLSIASLVAKLVTEQITIE